MRRRAPNRALTRVLVVVLAAFALGGVGATTALADDTLPPPITPPGATAPPDTDQNQVPPGPTYVITPGAGGSELGAPADPAEVAAAEEAAREAAEQAAVKAPKTPKKSTKKSTKAPGATVFGPQVPDQARPGSVPGPAAPLGTWWLIGSGAVLLLVLAEAGGVAARRFARDSG